MVEGSELGEADSNTKGRGACAERRRSGVLSAMDVMGEELSAAQKAGWGAGEQRRQV